MSDLTDFVKGGGVPSGDAIRTLSSAVTITTTGASKTTIMSLSSTKGLLKKIKFQMTNTSGSGANSGINVLTATIDGASERTLYASSTPGLEGHLKTLANGEVYTCVEEVEIEFEDSLVIKASKNSTAFVIIASCEYYVR